ncbi:MAG: ribosome assembly cofactor RimP, partial [Bacteroidota bacterium]
MITVEQIEKLVLEKIEGTDLFLVEVKVRPGNAIEIALDADSGLTVEDCKKVSRHVESSFDREVEDFSLEVSSPGVGKPLLVNRQFKKNVGRTVKVKTLDLQKFEGELTSVDENGIEITYKEKELVPGKKTKQWVEKKQNISFNNLKETKVVVRFN